MSSIGTAATKLRRRDPAATSNVRYAPESDGLLHCREMTLWAKSDILHCGKVLGFESADIAAVDGEIEQRRVALAVCQLKFCADRPGRAPSRI